MVLSSSARCLKSIVYLIHGFLYHIEPSTTVLHHAGHKFHEVFQHRHGNLADLPPAKLSEMITSTSLDVCYLRNLLFLALNLTFKYPSEIYIWHSEFILI